MEDTLRLTESQRARSNNELDKINFHAKER
jgi:hypothetical protein